MEPLDIQKSPIVHEEITLHGGVTIVNDTNQIINLRIQFELPGGYHLFMSDSISEMTSDKYVKMQGQLELNLYHSE